ncbi:tripartite tricarboxylate transporter TctB family protein [Phreatobacter stygius]|uniref:Tripartite tricarboxylate transporter TctB family protein n=1 Tax=Phreatobacter stygius TaxID=1940610 RepID=A0A4D7AUW1_9HYPH|nr:tripartite tricarboxylate transporter TctB family protein [Phreatobacter stygius]QCI65504.1 tripartite tricarboxylate transporter TctB family protein [Phreatobacter stygius]
MADESHTAPDRSVIAIGAALLVVSGVVFWQSWGLRASFGNQAIGPQMMPFLVSGLLAVFGVLTILEGLRGVAPARDSEDWSAVLWIAGGLAVMIALVKTAGFVPATALLFAATARAFGSTRALVDLALGAVIALVVYLFFVRVLGLSLPSGFVETLF